MESCPTIKNILLLDSEGKRVAVKYYTDDWPTHSAKLAFEKSLFTKTQKTNARTEAEIVMFDGYIVVYKFAQNLHFFVTGGDDENELILSTVLQGFFDAVGLLLRNNVDKRIALENLDLILLCLDEIVDGGYRAIHRNQSHSSNRTSSEFHRYSSCFNLMCTSENISNSATRIANTIKRLDGKNGGQGPLRTAQVEFSSSRSGRHVKAPVNGMWSVQVEDGSRKENGTVCKLAIKRGKYILFLTDSIHF